MVTPTIPSDESNAANVSRVRGNTSTTDTTAHMTASVDAQQTAETIRGIARRIREESIRMRELVIAIRQSGAVEELVDSFREASLATRDTAKEINEAARALRDRGAIRETAVAIDETAKAAQEMAKTKFTATWIIPLAFVLPSILLTLSLWRRISKYRRYKKPQYYDHEVIRK